MGVTFLREAIFIQVWLNQVIHSYVKYEIHDIIWIVQCLALSFISL